MSNLVILNTNEQVNIGAVDLKKTTGATASYASITIDESLIPNTEYEVFLPYNYIKIPYYSQTIDFDVVCGHYTWDEPQKTKPFVDKKIVFFFNNKIYFEDNIGSVTSDFATYEDGKLYFTQNEGGERSTTMTFTNGDKTEELNIIQEAYEEHIYWYAIESDFLKYGVSSAILNFDGNQYNSESGYWLVSSTTNGNLDVSIELGSAIPNKYTLDVIPKTIYFEMASGTSLLTISSMETKYENPIDSKTYNGSLYSNQVTPLTMNVCVTTSKYTGYTTNVTSGSDWLNVSSNVVEVTENETENKRSGEIKVSINDSIYQKVTVIQTSQTKIIVDILDPQFIIVPTYYEFDNTLGYSALTAYIDWIYQYDIEEDGIVVDTVYETERTELTNTHEYASHVAISIVGSSNDDILTVDLESVNTTDYLGTVDLNWTVYFAFSGGTHEKDGMEYRLNYIQPRNISVIKHCSSECYLGLSESAITFDGTDSYYIVNVDSYAMVGNNKTSVSWTAYANQYKNVFKAVKNPSSTNELQVICFPVEDEEYTDSIIVKNSCGIVSSITVYTPPKVVETCEYYISALPSTIALGYGGDSVYIEVVSTYCGEEISWDVTNLEGDFDYYDISYDTHGIYISCDENPSDIDNHLLTITVSNVAQEGIEDSVSSATVSITQELQHTETDDYTLTVISNMSGTTTVDGVTKSLSYIGSYYTTTYTLTPNSIVEVSRSVIPNGIRSLIFDGIDLSVNSMSFEYDDSEPRTLTATAKRIYSRYTIYDNPSAQTVTMDANKTVVLNVTATTIPPMDTSDADSIEVSSPSLFAITKVSDGRYTVTPPDQTSSVQSESVVFSLTNYADAILNLTKKAELTDYILVLKIGGESESYSFDSIGSTGDAQILLYDRDGSIVHNQTALSTVALELPSWLSTNDSNRRYMPEQAQMSFVQTISATSTGSTDEVVASFSSGDSSATDSVEVSISEQMVFTVGEQTNLIYVIHTDFTYLNMNGGIFLTRNNVQYAIYFEYNSQTCTSNLAKISSIINTNTNTSLETLSLPYNETYNDVQANNLSIIASTPSTVNSTCAYYCYGGNEIQIDNTTGTQQDIVLRQGFDFKIRVY